MARAVTVIGAAVGALLGILWLGLRVRAPRFPRVSSAGAAGPIPIPAGLPPPVARFARIVYGEHLPEVKSAMVMGRASMAPAGFAMPTRFRFYYDVARSSHYHDIQVTWFTLPVLRIHERNLEGHATLDLAMFGHVDDQPHTNRAAIQGYWAEVLAWIPAVALADPRVRWEPVDDATARLLLPGLDDEEAIIVGFDARTGLMSTADTMRYQDESRPERWRWSNRALAWGDLNGTLTMTRAETRWNDARPWATWEVEQVVLNVDVAARMQQFGGDIPADRAEG